LALAGHENEVPDIHGDSKYPQLAGPVPDSPHFRFRVGSLHSLKDLLVLGARRQIRYRSPTATGETVFDKKLLIFTLRATA
jgi:hypothetical protein